MLDFKNEFYKEVIEAYKGSELATLLENNPCNGFFELCQKYVDIGLNAPTRKNEVGGLEGCFQFSDIAIAKRHTIEFIHRFEIQDIDGFFHALENHYSHAIDPQDQRRRTKTIMSETFTYGTLYRLSELPHDIFQKIVQEIRSEL